MLFAPEQAKLLETRDLVVSIELVPPRGKDKLARRTVKLDFLALHNDGLTNSSALVEAKSRRLPARLTIVLHSASRRAFDAATVLLACEQEISRRGYDTILAPSSHRQSPEACI
jgi:hypothetical protein